MCVAVCRRGRKKTVGPRGLCWDFLACAAAGAGILMDPFPKAI